MSNLNRKSAKDVRWSSAPPEAVGVYQRIILGQQTVGNSTEIDPSVQFNGSTTSAWQNMSFDGSINNPNTGRIENDLNYSGYIARWRDGTKDWNITAPNDCTLVGNAVWNSSGLYTDGNGDSCNLGITKKLNLSGLMTIVALIKFNALASDKSIVQGLNEGTPSWRGYVLGLAGTDGTIGVFGNGGWGYSSAGLIATGVWNKLGAVFNSTSRIVVNGTSSASLGNRVGKPQNTTSRGIGGGGAGGNSVDGITREIVLYNETFNNLTDVSMLYFKSSSNSTFWNDFGSGRQGANVIFNFTNSTTTFVDAYASTDNFSTSNVLVASNITNATWVAIPASAKNQTQYVRALLKGNATSTPELMEVSIEDEAVSAGAPTAGEYPFWVGLID